MYAISVKAEEKAVTVRRTKTRMGELVGSPIVSFPKAVAQGLTLGLARTARAV